MKISCSSVRHSPYTRYLLPFALFWVLGMAQGLVEGPNQFWATYAAKILLTGAMILWLFRGHWREIQGRPDMLSVVVGLVVLVPWLIYSLMLAPDTAPAFHPYALPDAWIWPGIIFRTLGAVLLVPVLEELVWRSFVMRWLVSEDFLSVKLGMYTFWSFWGTVAAFMVVHAQWQWPVALFAGIAYGWYLVRTGNLVGCMIAHGVTNLGISLYAIYSSHWELWG